MSYHAIAYHVIPHHTIPHHILSCLTISYHTISYIISHHVISCLTIAYHTRSYHIISHHIISYHIISHRVASFEDFYHDLSMLSHGASQRTTLKADTAPRGPKRPIKRYMVQTISFMVYSNIFEVQAMVSLVPLVLGLRTRM